MEKIKWEQAQGYFESGIDGKAGKWKVFNVFWDGGRPRDENNKFSLKCFLPGIKNGLGHFKSEEDAMSYAEKAFAYWMEGLNELC